MPGLPPSAAAVPGADEAARRRRVRQDHLQRMLNGWIAEAS